MPAKPSHRNWNDVQTAIATVAIVTTLSMWNLFAAPAKKEASQTAVPPPPADESAVEAAPTQMPQIKIMFATQTVPQPAAPSQPQAARKVKNKGADNTAPVTKTKSS